MDTRAMFDGDQYCLRWSEADSNLSGAVSDIRDSGEFCDLTLACDDDKEIMVHRVILAACSTFFRNILNRLPHHHPLIYLRGIKQSDLQSIINFMYHGEVNVAQQDLRSFMMLAQDLKVKGLYQNQDITKTKIQPSASSSSCPPLKAAPVRKPSASRQSTSTPTSMTPATESNYDDNIENIKIKTETDVSDNNGDNNFYRHSPDHIATDNDIMDFGALPPPVGVSEGNKGMLWKVKELYHCKTLFSGSSDQRRKYRESQSR